MFVLRLKNHYSVMAASEQIGLANKKELIVFLMPKDFSAPYRLKYLYAANLSNLRVQPLCRNLMN